MAPGKIRVAHERSPVVAKHHVGTVGSLHLCEDLGPAWLGALSAHDHFPDFFTATILLCCAESCVTTNKPRLLE